MQLLHHHLSSLGTRAISTSSCLFARAMAKSRFEYVKKFEAPDQCLPNCWIVVRIDGKGFHKFSDLHGFVKPNDNRSLQLMNRSAQQVMSEFKEIILAYGQSDEYSFVFKKNAKAYNRRASKLMTTIASLFASTFVFRWSEYFPDTPLLIPPAFDGRTILYPDNQNLRDYLSWRQADCHINNLYNTVFWKLVQSGLTNRQAQERLKGTSSGDKNEILFSEFNTNYNTLPELYRKGSILVREKNEGPVSAAPCDRVEGESGDSGVQTVQRAVRKGGCEETGTQRTENTPPSTQRQEVTQLHCDLIGRDFWRDRPHLLGEGGG